MKFPHNLIYFLEVSLDLFVSIKIWIYFFAKLKGFLQVVDDLVHFLFVNVLTKTNLFLDDLSTILFNSFDDGSNFPCTFENFFFARNGLFCFELCRSIMRYSEATKARSDGVVPLCFSHETHVESFPFHFFFV